MTNREEADELDSICRYIIDHPNHVKVEEFDLYMIFRFITITNKKKKLPLPSGNVLNFKIDDDDKDEFQNLVKRINPFYNYKDDKKNQYYVFNFLLSKKLVSRTNEIKKTRDLPHSFFIYSPEKAAYLKGEEIDLNDSCKEAVFYDGKQARFYAEKLLAVYESFGIPKSIEIHSMNLDKQVIHVEVLKTSFCEQDGL